MVNDDSVFRNIFEQFDSGLIIVDKNCKVTSLNKAGAQALKITATEILNKNFEDFFNIDREDRIFSKTIISKENMFHRRIVLHPNKSAENIIVLGIGTSILKDEYGEISAVCANFRELKAIKEREATETLLQKELLRTKEKLEATIEELKRAQDKIINAEKFEMLGKIAGYVSHELRNPFGTIKNAQFYIKMKLEKIRESVNDEKIFKFVDMIDTEITKCNNIISEILSLARQRKPQFKKENVIETIEDALFSIDIPVTVKIIKKYDSDLSDISIDKEQIRLVLINIINNAVQAMKGIGDIIIETALVDEYVNISITDTGGGIDPKIQAKIFQSICTTKEKGTGLGLFIVKDIVNAHHGKITCSSEQDKGARFDIFLPVNN